jgi:hypothetical protein
MRGRPLCYPLRIAHDPAEPIAIERPPGVENPPAEPESGNFPDGLVDVAGSRLIRLWRLPHNTVKFCVLDLGFVLCPSRVYVGLNARRQKWQT